MHSLKIGQILGYFNTETYPIIKRELGNFELRHMFYAVVTYLRKLRPDLNQLISQINNQRIEVIMVYGKFDHHFPESIGKIFEPQLFNVKQLVVERGHDMVDVDLSKEIRKII